MAFLAESLLGRFRVVLRISRKDILWGAIFKSMEMLGENHAVEQDCCSRGEGRGWLSGFFWIASVFIIFQDV